MLRNSMISVMPWCPEVPSLRSNTKQYCDGSFDRQMGIEMVPTSNQEEDRGILMVPPKSNQSIKRSPHIYMTEICRSSRDESLDERFRDETAYSTPYSGSFQYSILCLRMVSNIDTTFGKELFQAYIAHPTMRISAISTLSDWLQTTFHFPLSEAFQNRLSDRICLIWGLLKTKFFQFMVIPNPK